MNAQTMSGLCDLCGICPVCKQTCKICNRENVTSVDEKAADKSVHDNDNDEEELLRNTIIDKTINDEPVVSHASDKYISNQTTEPLNNNNDDQVFIKFHYKLKI